MLQQGHFEARRLIAGVRPPILDEEGVVAAVAHLVNEQSRLKGPKIEYRSRVDFDRLAPILENAIYRIAQEGLANACQHSKSEKVRVSLLQREDRVRIEIRDWGIGFDPKAVRGEPFRSGGHPAAGKAAGRQVQHPKHGGQRHSHYRRVAGGVEGVNRRTSAVSLESGSWLKLIPLIEAVRSFAPGTGAPLDRPPIHFPATT